MENDIQEVAVWFFSTIFSCEYGPSIPHGLLDLIPTLGDSSHNIDLHIMPNLAKVKETVLSLDGDNAPGPNDLIFYIYLKYYGRQWSS